MADRDSFVEKNMKVFNFADRVLFPRAFRTSYGEVYKDWKDNKLKCVPETTGSKTPLGTTAQPQINTKFGFPFAIGTTPPKLQGHNNFSLNPQYMPFPVLVHKGISTMTPVYGTSSTNTTNNDKKLIPQFQLNTSTSGIERKKHKPFMERPGDWVCAKCKNLNFAFRLTCNRCHLQKTESEKIGDAPQANTNKKNISNNANTNSNSTIQDNHNITTS